jgi:hypothetical protein
MDDEHVDAFWRNQGIRPFGSGVELPCWPQQWAGQVMLPGKKQRIEVPDVPFTGHTIVRPARLGSVMTASSGTMIHSPSRRTR